ncbi:hypothetical protein SBA3_3660008 [Candidatus Sulfopaludibacter sp. SbA3]|nr:hypothetical protein SBA3_3660008 [Candidatus Sulfopaludibacter sp. SbA3]
MLMPDTSANENPKERKAECSQSFAELGSSAKPKFPVTPSFVSYWKAQAWQAAYCFIT